MKWLLTILGTMLASYTALATTSSCSRFYQDQANRSFAFELMRSTELDGAAGRQVNPLPPSLSFQEFADGVSHIRDTLFKNTEEFLAWRTQGWTQADNMGTYGYKVLKIAVAVRLENKEVKLVPLYMFDKDGTHGSHREMAMLAGEGFGEEPITYFARYHSLYHGQIVISKFAGEDFYEFINSGDYDIRVHAQWYLENNNKMPDAWKRLIEKVTLK